MSCHLYPFPLKKCFYNLATDSHASHLFYFTTGNSTDAVAPEVALSSFADGTNDVPVNGRIVFTLDERLGGQCPLSSGITLSSSVGDEAIAVTLNSDRQTLVIDPVDNLQTLTDYTVTLMGLCDYAGNVIAPVSLSFTTSADVSGDTTRPTLSSITPGNNSTGIDVNTTIVMTFSEIIDLNAAPPVVGAGVTVPGSYVIDGNTMTFTPSISLQGNTRYTIQLYNNVFDLAGNRLGYNYRYFTTEALSDVVSPTVVSIAPEASAVDVNPNASVVLTFSEPMSPATLNTNNIAFYSNGQVISATVYRRWPATDSER